VLLNAQDSCRRADSIINKLSHAYKLLEDLITTNAALCSHCTQVPAKSEQPLSGLWAEVTVAANNAT